MTYVILPPEPELVFSATIFGDVDLARVPELHGLVEDFRRSPATDVVIDLQHVDFMDSTGLGFLARVYRDAHDRGGSVTVTHACREVEQVIRITGMDHLLCLGQEEP